MTNRKVEYQTRIDEDSVVCLPAAARDYILAARASAQQTKDAADRAVQAIITNMALAHGFTSNYHYEYATGRLYTLPGVPAADTPNGKE